VTSIFAIVSKAVFDREARNLGIGDVYRTDRYNSTNAALQPLEEGGALFLVTVKPEDQLWLVAILENPHSDGQAWVAAQNAVPIVNITPLCDQIQFSTGKGIQIKPGKLGMSLQTPRQLTDEDVALLRNAATPGAGDGVGNAPGAGSTPLCSRV